MIASFAFNKATSPLSRISSSHVKSYDAAQYMARCQFTNVFWEYDRQHNYAPVLVFEGDVERLDTIDTKFPHNVDTLYFTKDKPRIRFDYKPNDEQYAVLASKGFYSDGVHIPEMFTTAKLDLECDATVYEIVDAYEKQNVPIFEVNIEHPYENEFSVDQYELFEYITREQTDDNKALNNKTYQDYVPEMSVEAEVEAAKAAAQALAEQQRQAEYKPLTAEEMEIKRQSNNVSSFVDERRERLYGKRNEHNEAAAAEKARLEAEKAEKEGRLPEPERDKNLVEFDDAPISKANGGNVDGLAGKAEENKFESNADIFNNANEEQDDGISDDFKAFMQSLEGDSNDDNVNAEDSDKRKSDNKNGSSDTGSGAASGAQGLGVYTFEDQDTAQFAIRQDEGAGNEKPDEDKSDNDVDSKPDSLTDNKAMADKKTEMDKKRREVLLQSAINDTTVSAEAAPDERSK